MRKRTFTLLLACAGAASLFQSCRNDRSLTEPLAIADQSFVEEFDTVSSSLSRGWVITNTSVPKGPGIWQQGGAINPWFSPYSSSGTYAGFIGVDYTSTSAAAAIISNWLISPVVTLQNGDKISFYTRGLQYPGPTAGDTTDYGNRLQVRINPTNASVDVGSGLETGSFTTPLLDINPTYLYSGVLPTTANPLAFPSNWTRFEATVYGLNGPTQGRFAFRYLVEGGGSNGLGSGVAIDRVQYTSVSK